MSRILDRPGAAPGGYEPFPEPSRGGHWGLKILAALVLLSLLAVAGLVVSYQRQADPPGPPGEEVKVTIPEGSSSRKIAQILADEGVISSAWTFSRVYLRLNGAGDWQAGEYAFRKDQSFGEAAQVLDKGPQLTFERLTVPEGLTLPQIAEQIGKLPGRSAERFLEVARSGQVRSRLQPPGSTNLEGLLLPDTYFVEPKDDERALLERMVKSFDDTATQLGYTDGSGPAGLSPYQLVTLASLVERETRFDDERGKVARVMYNRLERNQLLQVDATVIYALGKSADRNVRVLLKDLEVDSPYNTYKVAGLPPTPIAAPGKESLAAALDPEDGPWLFYVVTEPDGHHSFATTNAEHAANIRLAEKNGVR